MEIHNKNRWLKKKSSISMNWTNFMIIQHKIIINLELPIITTIITIITIITMTNLKMMTALELRTILLIFEIFFNEQFIHLPQET